MAAENIFVTGTAAEIKNVKSIEDQAFVKNKMYTELNQLFYKILNLEVDDYNHWITYVE